MKEDTILENNTQMNEETILESNSQMGESTVFEENTVDNENTAVNENMEAGKKKFNGKTWATVTLGGASGILLGAAGLLYTQKLHGEETTPPLGGEGDGEPVQHEPGTPRYETHTEYNTDNSTTTVNNNPEVVHHVHHAANEPSSVVVGDDISFADAFEAARAEVGPGGVFVWHGGVYNTFYAEEWNAMSPAEQQDFIAHVKVAVPVAGIPHLPTDTDPEPWPEGITGIDPEPRDGYEPSTPNSEGGEEGGLVEVEVDDQTRDNFDLGEDVHVVGFLKDGDDHLIAAYDHNEDGEVDFAIVDVDDNHEISDPDIRIDTEGNIETVGQYVARVSGELDDVNDGGADYTSDEPVEDYGGSDDPNLTYTSNEYDPSTDMPDYMDDALIDV